MTNYEIIIGYKAVITISVKATDEKEAKDIALKQFTKQRGNLNNKNIQIQDDNYKVDGICDMDRTWNMYDK
jgi:hypothetical protein